VVVERPKHGRRLTDDRDINCRHIHRPSTTYLLVEPRCKPAKRWRQEGSGLKDQPGSGDPVFGIRPPQYDRHIHCPRPVRRELKRQLGRRLLVPFSRPPESN
jgi:hypothetical protein